MGRGRPKGSKYLIRKKVPIKHLVISKRFVAVLSLLVNKIMFLFNDYLPLDQALSEKEILDLETKLNFLIASVELSDSDRGSQL